MDPHEETGLDRMLANAGDGAFAIGGDGRIATWNRAAERILGYVARETVGRPCCEILAGRDDSGNRVCYRGCHVMSLVRLGDPIQSFDMQTRTKSGRPLWINITILVAPNGHTVPMTIHLFRDVTATKELLRLVHQRLSAAAPPPAGDVELTRRELEVLRLMTEGANTKVTAERLHVSPATVRNHVQNILAKLGVHSRLEAVARAASLRLL